MHILELIDCIRPDADSRKHECEVSSPNRHRTFSLVLSCSTRNATSSLPGEIFSLSTCEYVASRMLNRFLRPALRAHLHTRNSKVRSPKSRQKSCTPCALAKCKCDLQQPCSCCTAKNKECTFTDSKSVTAIKVTPAGISKAEFTATPSTSSDNIFTSDAFISSHLRSRAAEKHLDDRYPPDVSSNLCLAASLDLMIANQNRLDDTGQFIGQFNSPCPQDIFFDWNVPPGCSPLDFTSTFSPIYAPMETTSLGIISDSSHILTYSAYLEPESSHQSAEELKRYCMFLIHRLSSPLIIPSSRNCNEDVYHLPPRFTLLMAERRKITSSSDNYASRRGSPRKIPRSPGTSVFCHRRHGAGVDS